MDMPNNTVASVNQEKTPRILVYRAGAIGDTIVMSVVYQALRRNFPFAYIEAIGPAERLSLINPPGLIDRIISIDMAELAFFFSERHALPTRLALHFRSFDFILIYSFDRETGVAKRFREVNGQCYRFDPFPPADAGIHVTTYLLGTLATLGIDTRAITPKVFIPDRGIKTAGMRAPCIAVHPGSGSTAKNWPAGQYAGLCDRFSKEYQAQLLLISGPADKQTVQQILRDSPGVNFEVLDHRPLPEIAGTLQQCALYIGNDSGISHLAAAVGVPAIVIFRTSNPDVWRPIGEKVHVLQDDSFSGGPAVFLDRVYDAANRILRL